MLAQQLRAALIAVSLAACAGSAVAQNVGFMRDSVMSEMTQDDTAMMWSNAQQAADLPDGHVSAWTNPKTGHSGTAKPTRSFQDKGMACRQLDVSNTARGKTATSSLAVCKTKAGWRMVN
jgi:surface antigen